ncbi:MAG TPA: phosphate ABC transporter substrate-binding protein [Pirellulales bacterium]|nr:phosphate ABC transporter substrate-binding protein [Pirellulales bacterium]
MARSMPLLLALGAAGCSDGSAGKSGAPSQPTVSSSADLSDSEANSVEGVPAESADASAAVPAGDNSTSAAGAIAEEAPAYEPVEGVSGTIKSVGSDTMVNLMTYWCQGFRKHYPNVQTEVEGKGSSSALPALTAGTANFGPMSRSAKGKELDEFEAKFGYKPTALKTSIDMLAVYVHKDNPIKGLTFQQLDAVFSKNRKGGHPNDIRNWGELGLTGPWASKPISLYGRNSASGTYGYFKEHVSYNGDFKDSVIEQPGSSAVVQAVARDKWGIGYSGIGYLTADVRAVPLSAEEGEDFVPADPENAYSGAYPLSRFLYLYVNYKPGSDLDPLRREFIKYIFSREGQQDVVKEGSLPVRSEIAAETLESLGITAQQ